MIRLFKHYVPHVVLMLGLVDLVLLIMSAEIGWVVRANQIGMQVEPMHTRIAQLLTFAIALQVSLVAVGAYGVASFLSLRFAAARLAVALSLGVMFLSLIFFLVPPLALWRSNLLYSTVIATVLLVTVRALLGKTLGAKRSSGGSSCWGRACARHRSRACPSSPASILSSPGSS